MIKKQMFVEENNMSNLTSAVSADASVSSDNQQYNFSHQNQSDHHHQHDQQLPEQPPSKKKRSLPGQPDPDAEVIAMSPKSLLATNRFVCEICNKGFQRDQNLQLHRRGHNLPWKLKQRSKTDVIRKKVYVCPEATCVHHDPSRALGDLTGIKKHFCRKHGEKKWKCDKCSKRYAVQSDWKAHSKICGTREYRCDCGTLFSRRDSFITHRAFCDALAEETARSVTPNSLLISNPSSNSHFININLQQQALQFTDHNPLQSFPLKREQQTLMNLPPWLSCPPSSSSNSAVEQHLMLSSSPSSSSPLIFNHYHQHQQQQQQQQQQQEISNPSNGGGPYQSHSQAAAHMSATALLQKAAEMGATMSKTAGGSSSSTTTTTTTQQQQQQQQGHMSDTISNTNTTTATAGLFGMNLSSHQQEQLLASSNSNTGISTVNYGLSTFGNKAATATQTTTATATATHIGGSVLSEQQQQFTGASSSSSSFLHDMMINSLSSTSYVHEDDDAFGIGGMLSSSKKDGPFEAFHPTLGGRTRNHGNGNGNGGGNNEGLTRDFLGLRPLSHNEMLTIAGLGNCMSNNTTTTNPNSQDSHTKPNWQGN